MASASELTGIDKKSGMSSPFVKLTVGKTTVTTNVAKKNLSPVWNELFFFELGSDVDIKQVEITAEVRSKTVVKSEFLGTVVIPLTKVKPERIIDQTFKLKERKRKKEKVKVNGQIRMRIYFSKIGVKFLFLLFFLPYI